MDDIAVVMSADARFAIGLAGTFKSLLAQCRWPGAIRLFVLDGGLSAADRSALIDHWKDDRLSVEWITIDRHEVSDFVVTGHVSDATYYRLLAPALLPEAISKFIYLDADMLVRRDITHLWQEPLGDQPCLAVQDPGAPFVDSAIALAANPTACKHIVNQRPIPNYGGLGLVPTAAYFNGGLMVVNLELWRREQLAVQMMDVLNRHREHVTYWDQYALNVVLSGRWRALDPRWNQNALVLRLPGWDTTIFAKDEYERYARDPWIVHFNWLKPWQAECLHPYADTFLTHLAGSLWETSLVRVSPPPRSAHRPPRPLPRRSKIKKARDYVRTNLRKLRHGVLSLLGRRAA
jgi:lipopolysaccharide biosynthesis glycosyltransferase